MELEKQIYSRDYFLSDCEGFAAYRKSCGIILSKRLKKILKKADIQPGMRVLDIGCGRGELVIHSAKIGAEAVGVDYSSDACSLCAESRSALFKTPKNRYMRFLFCQAEAESLPFKEQTFDTIIIADLLEHLSQKQLRILYDEMFRLLKPQGKVVLHTSPNRIFLKYGLLFYSFIGLLNGKFPGWNPAAKLPAGCRKPFHINEQTIGSIRRAARNSRFTVASLQAEKNPHYIYFFFEEDAFVRRVNFWYRLLPFKQLFCADIYGVLVKNK